MSTRFVIQRKSDGQYATRGTKENVTTPFSTELRRAEIYSTREEAEAEIIFPDRDAVAEVSIDLL